jgi:hypothetical protein
MYSFLSKLGRATLLCLMIVVTMYDSGCGGGSSSSGGSTTSPGVRIAVTFGGGVAPQAVASQIGANSWSIASLQGQTLNLTLPDGTSKYGIAYVCGTGQYISEYVAYATPRDGSSYTVSCYQTPPLGVVNGTVDASVIPGAAGVEIVGLLGSTGTTFAVSGPFNTSMATGLQDIAFVALNAKNEVLAVHIVRSQAVPGVVNGGNAIAFLATDAVSLQSFAVTAPPAGFAPLPAFSAAYTTANGTSIDLFSTSAGHYLVIPSTQSQPGDYYFFTANDSNFAPGQAIYTSLTTPIAGAIKLALPAPLTYSAPTPAAFPNFNLAYTGFAGDAAVFARAQVLWAIPPAAQSAITVTATEAYQDGSTMLAIPNLTGLSGFLPSASSGTAVGWQGGVYGGSYAWYAPTPVNGSLSFAVNGNTFVAP